MQYAHRSFSISQFASVSHIAQMKQVCVEHGHMQPADRRGRCWRCAEKIEERQSPGHGRRQADESPSSASSIHVAGDVYRKEETLRAFGIDAQCVHSEPDYYGRCVLCGVRLEAPSQWMRDEAKRIGGSVVSMTATISVPSIVPETGV